MLLLFRITVLKIISVPQSLTTFLYCMTYPHKAARDGVAKLQLGQGTFLPQGWVCPTGGWFSGRPLWALVEGSWGIGGRLG